MQTIGEISLIDILKILLKKLWLIILITIVFYKEDIKMAVVKLTTDNFEQEVLQAQQPVLVDFYADWCGPCKMMAPIVEALSAELSDVKVCHINIDENIDIAQKYRVMSIPTFIAFKGGEESGRQIGAIPKTALVDLVK